MAAENLLSDVQADAIRVFVADSTLMGNQLLAAALSRDRRFFVVGTAEAAEQLLAGIRHPVDVAIISGMLAGSSPGVHLNRQLLSSQPGLRIVMLLERPERAAVVEAFRAGATGVFCRAEPIEALCKCIESVHRGKVWANDGELRFVLEELGNSPALRVLVQGEPCSLAGREQKIVRLVAEGFTNRQIAAELGLNEHTLKSSLQRLFDKLGVSRPPRSNRTHRSRKHHLARHWVGRHQTAGLIGDYRIAVLGQIRSHVDCLRSAAKDSAARDSTG